MERKRTSSQPPSLTQSHGQTLPNPITLGVVLVLGLVFKLLRRAIHDHSQIRDIPAIGYGGILTSYVSAFQYALDANSVLQAGYKKYRGRLFKVAQIDRWFVIVTGEKLLEDLRTAPEHVLSMEAAMLDLLQADYTLGEEIRHDTYHLGVIRNELNKNLERIFPEVLDETVAAFHDIIDSKLSDRGWTSIPAVSTFTQIVCRAMNRSFVGLPLCRNQDYCDINIQFLKPLAGRAFTRISGLRRRVLRHLRPLIEERRKHMEEYGTASNGENANMIDWLMDAAAPGLTQTPESLALRMLNINFVALHSTSMTFTHALFHLASRPQYAVLIREELEANIHTGSQNVWGKGNLEKCWKLDSFLRESQRLNGLGALALPRRAMVPYTFSDGTVVPPGTIITAAPTAIHLDDALYENPNYFDGFRFSKMRERLAKGGENTRTDEKRLRLTSTGLDYLGFGGGRHTCPGRFLAALELKCMLAHLILHYDVRTEVEGVRPPDTWFGPACMPSRSAKVLFRKRNVAL
ncbi:cytochrome P450 [Infundibulicybe gibba]|nr:cytochrome P450 [Infundibulicybe gibba]